MSPESPCQFDGHLPPPGRIFCTSTQIVIAGASPTSWNTWIVT